MDMIPRNDYGERCQFDAYCKLVLYHEAIDYLREMQRRRDRELSFSDIPQMEMDKMCIRDSRPGSLSDRPGPSSIPAECKPVFLAATPYG